MVTEGQGTGKHRFSIIWETNPRHIWIPHAEGSPDPEQPQQECQKCKL